MCPKYNNDGCDISKDDDINKGDDNMRFDDKVNSSSLRADRSGPHRAQFEKNKKRLLRTENTCGICGRPIDMSLKPPHPLSPCIDHIIPISKGGHPSDISNLQLAHWTCNRNKSDKVFKSDELKGNSLNKDNVVLGNRNLPQTIDWVNYRSKKKD